MFNHNIETVRFLAAEPNGGYSDDTPVHVTFKAGTAQAASNPDGQDRRWGDDIDGGGVKAWRAENGDGAALPYEPVTLPPATDADVRTEGARRLALIGAPYSPEERETWSQQVMEAKAIQADANADAPLLTLLAAADGVTVADMAAAVISKAEAFAAAAGAVLAAQRALLAMDPIPADYADASRWP